MESTDSLAENTWKPEQEFILQEWADKAQCYEWIHMKSHQIYKMKNALFTIPVIIISTITGTATLAQDKFGPYTELVSIVIGCANITAGIITTIHQFLKISEINEGHRVAALSWGKFFRYVKTELAKSPTDREDPLKMIKNCKHQYDYLTETSPIVPEKVISLFKTTFKKKSKDVIKPEICDKLHPTKIFQRPNVEANQSPSTSEEIIIDETSA